MSRELKMHSATLHYIYLPKDQQPPLFVACRTKDAPSVKLLLDSNFFSGQELAVALQEATKNESHCMEIASLLLKHSNFSIEEINKQHVLVFATKYNRLDLIKLLYQKYSTTLEVNREVEFSFFDSQLHSYNPLLLACSMGRTEIVKYLLSLPNIDINKKNNETKDILFLACGSNVECVKAVLEYEKLDLKESFANNFASPFLAIFQSDNYKSIAEYLLRHEKIKPFSTPLDAFIVSCKAGLFDLVNEYLNDENFVKQLGENGINSTHKAFSLNPISAAISGKNYDIIRLLLHRKDLDLRNEKLALFEAIRNDLPEIFGLLLNTKIDVNYVPPYYSCKSPLIFTISEHKKKFIELLLSHPNLDINARKMYDYDGDGMTNALYESFIYGSPSVTRMILCHPKINVFESADNQFNKENPSLLEVAYKENMYNAVNLMLRHKDFVTKKGIEEVKRVYNKYPKKERCLEQFDEYYRKDEEGRNNMIRSMQGFIKDPIKWQKENPLEMVFPFIPWTPKNNKEFPKCFQKWVWKMFLVNEKKLQIPNDVFIYMMQFVPVLSAFKAMEDFILMGYKSE